MPTTDSQTTQPVSHSDRSRSVQYNCSFGSARSDARSLTRSETDGSEGPSRTLTFSNDFQRGIHNHRMTNTTACRGSPTAVSNHIFYRFTSEPIERTPLHIHSNLPTSSNADRLQLQFQCGFLLSETPFRPHALQQLPTRIGQNLQFQRPIRPKPVGGQLRLYLLYSTAVLSETGMRLTDSYFRATTVHRTTAAACTAVGVYDGVVSSCV